MFVTEVLDMSFFPFHPAVYHNFQNCAECFIHQTDSDNRNPGQVIETFGNFVGGGDLIVGIIVYIHIIIIVQFVVINKGSERVAEVTARFTLDAMPGKQMAIDADLNTGAIDDKEARRRREKIQEEASFFGSMDGASKYVKGDAAAGLIITGVNIVGGIAMGMLRQGLISMRH
jgi:flagellar biosynthesis protein FlhA